MSDILKSEILPTIKTKKDIKNSKAMSESKKEGGSLFDNILKQTKQLKENNKTKNNQANENIKTSKDKLEQKIVTKNGTKKESKPISLLDKMVKNIELEKKGINNKSDKDNKAIKGEDKNILQDNKKAKESKPISLLDKMVKDIELEKKEAIKNKSDKDNKAIKGEDKNILQDNKKENIQKENIETSKSSLEKKASIKEGVKKESKPISLLDKMVKDIELEKKSIDKTKDENKDIKVSKHNVVLGENSENKEEKVDKKLESKSDKTNSLLDSLVEQSKTILEEKSIDNNINRQTIQKSVSSKVANKEDKAKNPLQANMFLSNQKSKQEIISKQKIIEAKETLNENKEGVKGVKKAAKTLELNLNEVVAKKEEISQEDIGHQKKNLDQQIKQQNSILNRVFLKSFSKLKEIHNSNISKEIESKNIEAAKIKEDNKTIDDEIELVVERGVANSITTKIIESKQKINSFMSDIAKNMYANYKPPITAFRISLTPAYLGNIAIIMKSNKSENTLSVSLNMSQNSTLEALSDNRSTLQNNLLKLFSEDTKISLEFGMQNSDSNSAFEQFKEQQKQQKASIITTTDILENQEKSSIGNMQYM